MKESSSRDAQEQTPPQRLIDALRAEASTHQVIVPERIDFLIRQRAEAHLKSAHQPREQSPSSLWDGWFLRAAALFCVLGLIPFLVSHHGTVRSDVSQLRPDRSSQVNILAAFSLARRLHQQQILAPEFDLNNDGVVDSRDVEDLAARAVALGNEEN